MKKERSGSSIKNTKNRRMTGFSSRPKKERLIIKLIILLDDDINDNYIGIYQQATNK